MAKQIFDIPVQRIVYGTVHIAADSEEEALKIARDYSENHDIDGNYVDREPDCYGDGSMDYFVPDGAEAFAADDGMWNMSDCLNCYDCEE